MNGKKRRQEILDRRHGRMQYQANTNAVGLAAPRGSVIADHAALSHNNTCGRLPRFYMDRVFFCADCGIEQIWTAKQQKWWYEIAKGNINSTAIRCRPGRKKKQQRISFARRIHLDGLDETRISKKVLGECR